MIALPLRARNAAHLIVGLSALSLVTAGCGFGSSLPLVNASHASKHHGAGHARLVAYAGKGHRSRARVVARPAERYRQRRVFAQQVLPIVANSSGTFDRAAAAVSGVGLDSLDSICGNYLNQVQIESSYVDGVPHPFSWYSAAGAFHHQVLGVYHDMAGALVACQTAVQAGDSGSAATATSDVSNAAASMRSLANYTRWLANHRL